MILFQSAIIELAKEIEYICAKDPSHRIDINKHSGLAPLARQINSLVDYCQALKGEEGDKQQRIVASVGERQTLTAFISQLPQGIIVCDASGIILLCNNQAKNYLFPEGEGGEGLSLKSKQPITTLIDKNFIEHALDEINARLKREIFDASSHFLIQRENIVLQAQVVPVLNEVNNFTGFVLILTDITRQNQTEKRIESLLHTLSKNARSPLASIRAAIEAMTEFPDMGSDRQSQFKEIIRDESLVLSDILSQVSSSYASLVKTKKSLKAVSGFELLETVSRRSHDKLGIGIVINQEESKEDIFIKADPFSFITVFLFILQKLNNETGLWEFECRVFSDEKIASIDIIWHGKSISPDSLRQWETLPLADTEYQAPNLTIRDVLSQHQAAIGAYSGGIDTGQNPYIRFFVPAQKGPEENPLKQISLLPESRTQLSDLELFSHSALTQKLDERLLTELSYTSLIRKITQAISIEEVIGKHSQLPRLIHSMITSGTKIRTVTWLVSAFADAILTKLLDLAIEEIGNPPVPFAFLCLGSEGRNEQTLKTDQDNAIVYMDIESDNDTVQDYFLKLGEMVCMWLDQAGYDLCMGGIMAKNPQWCQPLSVWKNYFSDWLHTNEPEHILHATIFFDFRFAYGDRSITDSLSEHLFHTLPGKTNFFRSMAKSSINFKPPIGLFGTFILTSDEDHKKCLDIKKAITPIVDYARLFSLKNDIREISTQDRIYQLYLKRVLSRDDYNEIDQIYSFLMQVRFLGQIDDIIQQKRPPHNFINPKQLSSIERKMLKEVLVKIKEMQSKLCLEFTGTSTCQ